MMEPWDPFGMFGRRQTAPPAVEGKDSEPARGVEAFVEASMIVKTNAEATTNIRIRSGQTIAFNPGHGETLEDRRKVTDRELAACLSDLMHRAELIRSGHSVETPARPLPPSRGGA